IEWTGDGWALTDSSTEHPPFEACRGRRVTWSLGATPSGNREHFLAWVHVAPAFFEPDSTFEASSGFASVSASKPVTLRVRDDAPAENLQYAVLVLNVTALNPGLLKQLDKDLRGRRYGQVRRFENLTFVQQGSPPQMIIRSPRGRGVRGVPPCTGSAGGSAGRRTDGCGGRSGRWRC